MTKEEKIKLAQVLEAEIERANMMFTQQEQSQAYIIGYLEGVIKRTIRELKD